MWDTWNDIDYVWCGQCWEGGCPKCYPVDNWDNNGW
jgi:hypothetical protein